jgi:uncharacterized protein YcsI (UPF0317 family)
VRIRVWEFTEFCLANARAMPLTDLPRYRVYRRGELVDQPSNIRHLWTEDLVGFLRIVLGVDGAFVWARSRR